MRRFAGVAALRSGDAIGIDVDCMLDGDLTMGAVYAAPADMEGRIKEIKNAAVTMHPTPDG